VLVDASVWISAIRSADTHHTVSRAWLARQIQAQLPLYAPVIVLPEVAGPLARMTGRPQTGLNGLRQVQTLANLIGVDLALAQEAGDLAANLRIRGADAVYVAAAKRLSLPLVTWDTQVLARASAVIQVIEPV